MTDSSVEKAAEEVFRQKCPKRPFEFPIDTEKRMRDFKSGFLAGAAHRDIETINLCRAVINGCSTIEDAKNLLNEALKKFEEA